MKNKKLFTFLILTLFCYSLLFLLISALYLIAQIIIFKAFNFLILPAKILYGFWSLYVFREEIKKEKFSIFDLSYLPKDKKFFLIDCLYKNKNSNFFDKKWIFSFSDKNLLFYDSKESVNIKDEKNFNNIVLNKEDNQKVKKIFIYESDNPNYANCQLRSNLSDKNIVKFINFFESLNDGENETKLTLFFSKKCQFLSTLKNISSVVVYCRNYSRHFFGLFSCFELYIVYPWGFSSRLSDKKGFDRKIKIFVFNKKRKSEHFEIFNSLSENIYMNPSELNEKN